MQILYINIVRSHALLYEICSIQLPGLNYNTEITVRYIFVTLDMCIMDTPTVYIYNGSDTFIILF